MYSAKHSRNKLVKFISMRLWDEACISNTTVFAVFLHVYVSSLYIYRWIFRHHFNARTWISSWFIFQMSDKIITEYIYIALDTSDTVFFLSFCLSSFLRMSMILVVLLCCKVDMFALINNIVFKYWESEVNCILNKF